MKNNWRWHLAGWILFLVYQTHQDFWVDSDWDWTIVVLYVTYYLVVFTAFYFTYSFLCPRLASFNNQILLLLAIPIGVAFFIAFRYFIQEIMCPAIFGFGNYYIKDRGFYILDNIWRGFVPITAGILVFLLENKNRAEKAHNQLITEKTQAELAFLRAQLNPHFLFNTLSFLHTKAFTIDPDLANTILKLSDVLRYSVQSGLDQKRSLEEEVKLLNNYIDIFRKRFGDNCFLNFAAQGKPLEQQIEPLLLLPFVENAFKHGIYSNPEKPIEVKLTITPGKLNFYCQNHIKHQQKDPGTGVGLENIKRRLNLLYHQRHQLNISETEELFTVQLTVGL